MSTVTSNLRARVIRRVSDVVYVDTDGGRRLRDALDTHRRTKNAADKDVEKIKDRILDLMDGANYMATSDGQGLFYIVEANRAPAVDWITLEADLASIGKTRADYETPQEPIRRLMISPSFPNLEEATEERIPAQKSKSKK